MARATPSVARFQGRETPTDAGAKVAARWSAASAGLAGEVAGARLSSSPFCKAGSWAGSRRRMSDHPHQESFRVLRTSGRDGGSFRPQAIERARRDRQSQEGDAFHFVAALRAESPVTPDPHRGAHLESQGGPGWRGREEVVFQGLPGFLPVSGGEQRRDQGLQRGCFAVGVGLASLFPDRAGCAPAKRARPGWLRRPSPPAAIPGRPGRTGR